MAPDNEQVSLVPRLVETNEALTSAVDKLAASNDRRSRRNAAMLTLIALLAALAVAAPLYIRHLGSPSREGIRRIVDCTTAGGVCYEQGAADTRKAIEEIGRQNASSNLALTVCLQRNPSDERALRECAAENVPSLR